MPDNSRSLAAGLRRGAGQLPYRALALVWDASRGWTALRLALLVVQGLLPAAIVYLTRALVNSLVVVVDSHGSLAAIRPALLLALLMAVIMLLGQGLGSLAGWVRMAQSERVADYTAALVYRQSVRQDLDLAIAPGQVAAIVGPNGTGKSTLIKLLCRFYDPQAGHFELDSVDLRSRITVLVQEPAQYNATAAQNIFIGAGTEPRADIEAAARAVGADGPIARLAHGYDTVPGTRFEGATDLSAGEWQRIALARAFLRRAPVVLDEPASAMDSWAEADWLARFRALVAGQAAIFIWHRLTTARYADVIHDMDAGRIVESRSHEELVPRAGRYARSWYLQIAGGHYATT